MTSAKNRTYFGYTETHHIIPKCLGGSDDNYNLVKLSPEEHYLAHLLLTKIHPENMQLVHAAVMMTVSSGNLRRNNKLYGWLRRRHAEIMKVCQTGKGNSQYGRYWICNIHSGEIRRIFSSDPVPEGWIRGKTGLSKCKVCGASTGTRQRAFCDAHRPKKIPPKSTMSKGSDSAKKLSQFCKSRDREEHPQFGKRWINNGIIQKMVHSSDLETYLKDGWIRGKI